MTSKNVIISLTALFLLAILAFFFTKSNHHIFTNTANEIPAPEKTYHLLYSINSEDAILYKKSNENYYLILHDVHYQVATKSSPVKKKFTILLLDDFIKLWSENKNKEYIEADVTGVQVNNKTFGHTQFYAKVALSKPTYIKEKNELHFALKLIDNSKVTIINPAHFLNTTIFINGCDICSCLNNMIICKENQVHN